MTKIIAISGKAQSGKTTAAKIIQELLAEGWETHSFADKLKAVVSMFTGIPYEDLQNDTVIKGDLLGPEWEDTLGHPITLRQFFQKLGTEGMRDTVHPDIHVNGLFLDYKFGNRWIIPDVRMHNEFDAIKDRGGIVFRIERPISLRYPELHAEFEEWKKKEAFPKSREFDYDNWQKFLLSIGRFQEFFHRSECELDKEVFEEVIFNDGTEEELREEIKQRLIKLKLLKEEAYVR